MPLLSPGSILPGEIQGSALHIASEPKNIQGFRTGGRGKAGGAQHLLSDRENRDATFFKFLRRFSRKPTLICYRNVTTGSRRHPGKSSPVLTAFAAVIIQAYPIDDGVGHEDSEQVASLLVSQGPISQSSGIYKSGPVYSGQRFRMVYEHHLYFFVMDQIGSCPP